MSVLWLPVGVVVAGFVPCIRVWLLLRLLWLSFSAGFWCLVRVPVLVVVGCLACGLGGAGRWVIPGVEESFPILLASVPGRVAVVAGALGWVCFFRGCCLPVLPPSGVVKAFCFEPPLDSVLLGFVPGTCFASPFMLAVVLSRPGGSPPATWLAMLLLCAGAGLAARCFPLILCVVGRVWVQQLARHI